MTEKRRISLVVLIGVPGAGKTTFCRELRGLLQKSLGMLSLVLIISYDTLIPRVLPDHWKSQRNQVLQGVCSLIEFYGHSDLHLGSCPKDEGERHGVFPDSQAEILANNDTSLSSVEHARELIFIMDDNFYYRSMRHEIYQKAARYSTGYCQIVLSVDLDTAIQRNIVRDNPVPEDIVRRMFHAMETALESETSFEHGSLFISSPWICKDLKKAEELVLSSLDNHCCNPNLIEVQHVAAERALSQEISRKNVLHQADCVLRRLVRRECALFATSVDALRSNVLNMCRKTILDKLKKTDLSYFELRMHDLEQFVSEEFDKARAEFFPTRAPDGKRMTFITSRPAFSRPFRKFALAEFTHTMFSASAVIEIHPW